MPYMPSMPYNDGISKYRTLVFKGLNHNVGTDDGEVFDMVNMTGDNFPVLSNRLRRCTKSTINGPLGMYAHDALYIAFTDEYGDGKLYKDGVEIDGLTLSTEPKTMVAMGPYLIIMPDKMYYNVVTGEVGDMNKPVFNLAVQFKDGTYAGESALANTIYLPTGDWSLYYKAGDAVQISGCANTLNNKTAVVQEVDGHNLRFYENCFDMTGASGSEGSRVLSESSVSFSLNVPDMDYICENENRLWGCKGDTIFCSKLGDPFNFNCFDGLSTDSYAVDVGSAGDFTACVSYLGYPIFFKEEHIYKIYGSKPSNYQVMSSASLGVAEGSHKSLAVAGEVLFYLSRAGMVAYSGGTPSNVHQAFGHDMFSDAVAGSDGTRYYVSMRKDSTYTLYCYDTRIGAWYKEDNTQALDFAYEKDLHMMTADGKVIIREDGRTVPDTPVLENAVQSSVEFGDFCGESSSRSGAIPNRKGTSKLQIRLELEPAASVTVYIKYDMDAQWTTVKTLTATADKKWSTYLPVIPRRSDHYKIKITGTGNWKIYSLVREDYIGSEMF